MKRSFLRSSVQIRIDSNTDIVAVSIGQQGEEIRTYGFPPVANISNNMSRDRLNNG